MDITPYTKPTSPFDNALVDAVEQSDIEGVQMLLSLGANPSVIASNPGPTPLTHLAARLGNLEVLRVLVEAGAPWAAMTGMPGYELVHMAAFGNNCDLLRFVIRDLRQKLEAKDAWGQRPLVNAVLGNSLETAEELVRMGANVNAVDDTGTTPLMVAMDFTLSERNSKMVELLLSLGADSALKGESGLSANDLYEARIAYMLDSQNPEDWRDAELLMEVWNNRRNTNKIPIGDV